MEEDLKHWRATLLVCLGLTEEDMAKVALKFYLCASDTATSQSFWHIRPACFEKKLGGGIETGSMCGRVKAQHGWDLKTDLEEHVKLGSSRYYLCPRCLDIYEAWLARPGA
jgi:hypothetical protein